MKGFAHARVANEAEAPLGSWVSAVRRLMARYAIPDWKPNAGVHPGTAAWKCNLRAFRRMTVLPRWRRSERARHTAPEHRRDQHGLINGRLAPSTAMYGRWGLAVPVITRAGPGRGGESAGSSGACAGAGFIWGGDKLKGYVQEAAQPKPARQRPVAAEAGQTKNDRNDT